MKLWKLSVICLIAGLVFTAAAAVSEQTAISEKLIRLHVIAHSDSAEDQAVKLRVRDGILEKLEGVRWDSRGEAANWLGTHGEELRRIGEEISGKPVRVSLTEESYPTREYETFHLPAGEYLSLQVRIGDGVGKNWWCVVYPALCSYSQSDLQPMAVSAGFTADEVDFITKDSHSIRVKFKLLEWFEEWKKQDD